MESRTITREKMHDFMRVLLPIQMRLMEKYGSKCIYEWRQRRLNRPKHDISL